MFHSFSTTIGGAAGESTAEQAEELWDLLFSGIGA